MEPKTHDISGLSQNQRRFHRRPVEPMTAAEKIHRALADIQVQIGNLRRHRIDMGLVRVQLANMEAKWAH